MVRLVGYAQVYAVTTSETQSEDSQVRDLVNQIISMKNLKKFCKFYDEVDRLRASVTCDHKRNSE